MARRPTIRHIAVFTRDPDKLADFYKNVFDMDVLHRSEATETEGKAVYLSDGYLTLAILPHRLKGDAPVGINHFGFSVENTEEISKKLVAAGVEEPKQRPSTRPFAEHRGCDLDGNYFDLSEHGFAKVEYAADREKKKALAET
jgi:catechol 2,3-dioxygenase-like lactoylglutathione lyase family enzyme